MKKEKVKVFISQPTRDKTNEEIEKERERVKGYLDKAYGTNGYEIIDSFMKNVNHEQKPLFYLSKSLEMLSQADICYFVKGWQKSRGCLIEFQCCVSYGVDTHYE